MPRKAHVPARPARVTQPAPVGQHVLNLGSTRDSYFYVAPTYNPARAAPLVLLLHGAGGHAHHGLSLLEHAADAAGLILVAPASTDQTWDVVSSGNYGADVTLVDQALAHVFDRYAVDTSHLAIGGFSDGASYALSLGLANGDLFTHIIAFSPGFIAQIAPHGQPKVFISHGTHDDVLPIDTCSRTIAARLRQAKYDIAYREFDGGHEIPAAIAEEAVEWFVRQH